MTRFSRMLIVALIAFTGLFTMDGYARSHHHDDVKYIQGGASSRGDGSKNHPYSTLAQAQNGSWKLLKVLPSPEVLYGGIALKDGQCIKGKDRASCLLASLDGSVNNGDVIAANGDNCISGITIITSYRSAINAFGARNLTVCNCLIANCNPTIQVFPFDYASFSTSTEVAPFAAIDFAGGPTVTKGIQPMNTRSGKFTLFNCDFANNTYDVAMEAGDSISSTVYLEPTYKREYEVSQCIFSNTQQENSFVLFPASGGYIYGTIYDCTFENLLPSNPYPSAFAPYSINANNPNFPGRGNYGYGVNTLHNCTFKNISANGITWAQNGNAAYGENTFIIKRNEFFDVGYSLGEGPASPCSGYGMIQPQIFNTASGLPLAILIQDNYFNDSTGLAAGVAYVFAGGTQEIVSEFKENIVYSTSIGILVYSYNTGGPGVANGTIEIANNSIEDNDAVLMVGVGDTIPPSTFTSLRINAKNNCFKNIGARNTPPVQPPYTSYYGAAVLCGGADNTAMQNCGLNGSNLGNAIIDFGSVPLKSKGHNSFINITGADTWVEPGVVLLASKNWFDGRPPVDAKAGGTVIFDPVLHKNPHTCETCSK